MAETSHEVACVAVTRPTAGMPPQVIFASGPVDRPLFYRSAIKPFQALAAARAGLDLVDEHLALTCASHGGYPVHLAIVDQILADHELDRSDLRCPPDHPLAPGARRIQEAAGHHTRESRFHNCSGKHAGWLAASVIAGWDTRTYLAPDHPIQRSAMEIVADVTGTDPRPTGIDGCGAPTLRGDLPGLARAFLRLDTDPELRTIANAMHRFGALVADNLREDGRVAVNWSGPAKVGAEGLFAMCGQGYAIATKSIDGSESIAVAAALEVASLIGALPEGTDRWLQDVRRPPQFGGGVPVGSLDVVEV